MNPIKILCRVLAKTFYYTIILTIIVIEEWICRKDLTLKQSLKEFLNVKFWD